MQKIIFFLAIFLLFSEPSGVNELISTLKTETNPKVLTQTVFLLSKYKNKYPEYRKKFLKPVADLYLKSENPLVKAATAKFLYSYDEPYLIKILYQGMKNAPPNVKRYIKKLMNKLFLQFKKQKNKIKKYRVNATVINLKNGTGTENNEITAYFQEGIASFLLQFDNVELGATIDFDSNDGDEIDESVELLFHGRITKFVVEKQNKEKKVLIEGFIQCYFMPLKKEITPRVKLKKTVIVDENLEDEDFYEAVFKEYDKFLWNKIKRYL